MPDSSSGSARLARVVAIGIAVGIVVIMVGVRLFMQSGERKSDERKRARSAAVRAEPTGPGAGRSCTLSTKPSRATAYSLQGAERTALGITPVEVPQGEHTIRVELNGYEPVELIVGVHSEPCKLHRDLKPTDP